MLCNLLCQPDKPLGCLAAPEYRAACAYILQRSLSLRCVRLELLAAAARLPLPGGSLAVPGRAAELEWAEVADY